MNYGRLTLRQKANKVIDKILVDVLACPACNGDVKPAGKKIVCKKCGKQYPLRGGVPLMLLDEAEG